MPSAAMLAAAATAAQRLTADIPSAVQSRNRPDTPAETDFMPGLVPGTKPVQRSGRPRSGPVASACRPRKCSLASSNPDAATLALGSESYRARRIGDRVQTMGRVDQRPHRHGRRSSLRSAASGPLHYGGRTQPNRDRASAQRQVQSCLRSLSRQSRRLGTGSQQRVSMQRLAVRRRMRLSSSNRQGLASVPCDWPLPVIGVNHDIAD